MNNIDLNNRIAVVTGASQGLGYAISKYFTRKEYDVITFKRDKFDIHLDSIDFLIPFLTCQPSKGSENDP